MALKVFWVKKYQVTRTIESIDSICSEGREVPNTLVHVYQVHFFCRCHMSMIPHSHTQTLTFLSLLNHLAGKSRKTWRRRLSPRLQLRKMLSTVRVSKCIDRATKNLHFPMIGGFESKFALCQHHLLFIAPRHWQCLSGFHTVWLIAVQRNRKWCSHKAHAFPAALTCRPSIDHKQGFIK